MKTALIVRRGVFVFLVLVFLCSFAAACAEDAMAVGSVVTLGHYEQDKNRNNGTEEIQWIVLDRDGDRALLLSKYGLDAKQYNTKYTKVTWETCSLRKWLNSTFLTTAFTEEERELILETEVDNSPEQGYPVWRDTNSGNNTIDRMFLLSYAEANKYLGVTYEDGENVKARVAPTRYARSRRAWSKRALLTEDGDCAGRWWLRSPGRHPNRACHVHSTGAVRDSHVTSYNYLFGVMTVRPAMWIRVAASQQ
ncbi:MAG: hypothetical protein IKZ98_10430 [Clostridia bacterium]|nr:hypothetical protein [Clostridia bacterium]